MPYVRSGYFCHVALLVLALASVTGALAQPVQAPGDHILHTRAACGVPVGKVPEGEIEPVSAADLLTNGRL